MPRFTTGVDSAPANCFPAECDCFLPGLSVVLANRTKLAILGEALLRLNKTLERIEQELNLATHFESILRSIRGNYNAR
jgi:hypothetical protein